MKLFNEIKGFQTYVRDEGLLVKVRNKFTAWNIRNKIERAGYAVSMEKNKNHYIVTIWGAGLMDSYLLRNLDGCAA